MFTQSWTTCSVAPTFAMTHSARSNGNYLILKDDIKDSSNTGHVSKLPVRLNFFKPSLKLQKVTNFISHLSDTTL